MYVYKQIKFKSSEIKASDLFSEAHNGISLVVSHSVQSVNINNKKMLRGFIFNGTTSISGHVPQAPAGHPHTLIVHITTSHMNNKPVSVTWYALQTIPDTIA